MRKTGKARLAALLSSVCLILFSAASTAAHERFYIRNSDGNAVFRLDLFGQGKAYWNDMGALDYSVRDFTIAEIDDLRRGMDYWTAVLKPTGAALHAGSSTGRHLPE
jgi:hypothetical protein